MVVGACVVVGCSVVVPGGCVVLTAEEKQYEEIFA